MTFICKNCNTISYITKNEYDHCKICNYVIFPSEKFNHIYMYSLTDMKKIASGTIDYCLRILKMKSLL